MSKKTFAWVTSILFSAAAVAGCGSGSGSGSGGSGGATGGTGGSGSTAAPQSFVLVHGAFMGAWVWDSVAASLEAKGAKVTVVELPAHGEDMTPVKEATLDSYIAKVGSAVDAAGEPVVLVGHSMGGIVISSVAEQKPEKIEKLVYLAAILAKDGQSLQAVASQDEDSHLGPAVMVDAASGTAKLPVDQLQDIFCAECSADQVAAIESHYRDEPLAPLIAPVHVTDANWGQVPKYYIYTKQDNAVSYPSQQSMTEGVTFAGTATLDTGHSPFLSASDDVVSTLLGL